MGFQKSSTEYRKEVLGRNNIGVLYGINGVIRDSAPLFRSNKYDLLSIHSKINSKIIMGAHCMLIELGNNSKLLQ